MHKWFIAILIMALLPCSLQGQEAELKSTKAKAAVREYERKVEDVDKEFEKQLKDLEKSYQMKAELIRARLITNLNAAMEEEARKINLEEANKIKAVVDDAKKHEAPKLGGLMEQAGKKPTKTEKTKAPKVRIPKTALKFNGHRYQFVLVPTTWQKAKEYCDTVGGHLARLDTQGEQAFLTNVQAKNDLSIWWIDGGELVNEGEWIFSNGEKMDNPYIRWDRLPEKNKFEGRMCLWDELGPIDHRPDERFPFIIEWDK